MKESTASIIWVLYFDMEDHNLAEATRSTSLCNHIAVLHQQNMNAYIATLGSTEMAVTSIIHFYNNAFSKVPCVL